MKTKILVSIMFAYLPIISPATDGVWLTDSEGTYFYSDTENWENGIVAEGAGATAEFKGPKNAQVTTIIDRDVTLGRLLFPNASGGTSILSGDYAFIFNNGSEKSEITSVGNRVKPHFNVPIVLDNTTLRFSRTADGRACTPVHIDAVTGTGNLEIYVRMNYNKRTDLFTHLKFHNINISGYVSIEGSAVKEDCKEKVFFETPNTYTGGTFVYSNRLVVAASGGLGSGNVLVGADGELTLDASSAIDENATLSIMSDIDSETNELYFGKVHLGTSADIENVVGRLYFNNEKQANGIYTSETHPEVFLGNGILRVIPGHTFITIH